jgi:hypothetical protein
VRNIIVQTACSDTELSLDGVFTKAFVEFQNSEGRARPSSAKLHGRTPFVYIPWSNNDTVVFAKGVDGNADRSRTYLHLLAEPVHAYRPAHALAPAPALVSSSVEAKASFIFCPFSAARYCCC